MRPTRSHFSRWPLTRTPLVTSVLRHLLSFRAALSATLLGVLLVTAAPAAASHYFLTDVDFLAEPELDAFRTFGFQTTEDLLRGLTTAESRAQLSFSTGVPVERLQELTRMCDLLQVPGIGPRAARLLMASGVTSAVDLAGRDPAALLAEVETVNAVEQLTGVNPSIEHVRDWVAGAGLVTLVVTY